MAHPLHQTSAPRCSDRRRDYRIRQANDWFDFAYPLAAQTCCGTTAPDAGAGDSTYHGSPAPGVDCTFIDTRPAFEGHLADYIKSDNVHPTQAGATVISNLIWTQMQAHCIAQ